MVLLLVTTERAPGCPTHFVAGLGLQPGVGDEEAPDPPEILDVTVHRRTSNGGKGCEREGWIEIEVARPEGDYDGPDRVGYRIDHVDGRLPFGLELPSDVPAPWFGPSLVVRWTDRLDGFDATLGVVPVDSAGNEGDAAEVHVADAGCGCAAAASRGTPWVAVVAAAGAVVRRGRRRSR